jgi:pyruvate/2-oxoglutarate dehydrogenase complex dihydrolipoamide acyltransferase (E2) component
MTQDIGERARESAEGGPAGDHTVAHRVEYGLARTLEWAVSTLPEGAADAVGRRIGRAVYRLGIRRKVVEGNLRLAFPDADEAWMRYRRRFQPPEALDPAAKQFADHREPRRRSDGERRAIAERLRYAVHRVAHLSVKSDRAALDRPDDLRREADLACAEQVVFISGWQSRFGSDREPVRPLAVDVELEPRDHIAETR